MSENLIYRAMARNEMKEFLLGTGVYRHINSTDMGSGPDNHDIVITIYYIRDYLREHPDQEQSIYALLDKTMVKILEEGGAKNTFNCSMYIWSYFVDYKNEGILKTEWKFSEKLLTLLRERYTQYLKSGADFQFSGWRPETVKDLMELRVRLLKERFGFEICEIV